MRKSPSKMRRKGLGGVHVSDAKRLEMGMWMCFARRMHEILLDLKKIGVTFDVQKLASTFNIV